MSHADDWSHDIEVVRQAAFGGRPVMTERQMRLWRRYKVIAYGLFAVLGGAIFAYWDDLNLVVTIIVLFVGWKASKFAVWRVLGWDPQSPNGHKGWILEEAIDEGIVRRVDPGSSSASGAEQLSAD